MSIIASNRLARRDYIITDTFDAGIALTGQEVKSVKNGHLSLKGAYAALRGGEAYLLGATIAPYPQAGKLLNYDPTRSRKLLLRREELNRLSGALSREHLTLVPLEVYTHRGLVKVKLGLGRGKREYEKRETIKKREVTREVRRAIR